MKVGRSASVEELQVVSRYESLRKILLSDHYAEHLEKPLAYWALPTDRRLPLAFLGRTLQDLLNRPFDELAATPGIGQKKIRSFVKLLSRAANTDPSELPVDFSAPAGNGRPAAANGGAHPSSGDGFDPASVSEVVWGQWRATIARHGLGREALGRFAPSLKHMTRVIWNRPLNAYAQLTLAEIRDMKTHGEKRLRAILGTFHSVHAVAAGMGTQEHLVVRLVPRLIDQVENWVGQWLQRPGLPCPEEINRSLIEPLLEQIRIDASEQIVRLAENRVGAAGVHQSVRHVARTMGLTRARVYQLLNEINDIMSVRWPLGRHQLYELQDRLDEENQRAATPIDLSQFRAAVELFYPGERRGAAGPLQSASPLAEPIRRITIGPSGVEQDSAQPAS
jgi:hypothetical protein